MDDGDGISNKNGLTAYQLFTQMDNKLIDDDRKNQFG